MTTAAASATNTATTTSTTSLDVLPGGLSAKPISIGELRAALEDVSAVIDIESLTRYRFAEEPIDIEPISDQSKASAQPLAAPILSLEKLLYEQMYTFPFTGKKRPSAASEAPDSELIRRLSEANASRASWQEGWTLESIEPDGRVLARRGSGVRTLRSGEYVPSSVDGWRTMGWQAMDWKTMDWKKVPPAPGTVVRALLAKESLTLQPGFYVAFGEAVASAEGAYRGAVRFYFNVDADGAPALTHEVTAHLNRYQVPFSFKTLSQRGYFAHRVDSAVLFFHRRYFDIVSQMIPVLEERLDEHLHDAVPLFTRRLGRGIAIAEDPGTGDSFGLSRCRLVSRAIWQAWEQGDVDVTSRLCAIEREFQAAGLDLDRSHLGSSSADQFARPTYLGGPR